MPKTNQETKKRAKDKRAILSRGPGRPAEMLDGRRVELYLDEKTIEILRELGEGNLSAGARKAAEWASQ